MPDDAPSIEKILEICCPQIKHAKCSHKREDGLWDYWEADSGLCWCNKCGMCLNGVYESHPGFYPNPKRRW